MGRTLNPLQFWEDFGGGRSLEQTRLRTQIPVNREIYSEFRAFAHETSALSVG
jgi:hypothetical protein